MTSTQNPRANKIEMWNLKKSNYVLENTIFKVHMENVQESNYDKEFNKAQLSNWSG